MNKSVTKFIFPYSSFHAEHDGDIYFHVQQLLWKLEGLLQPCVSLFVPPPYPVLSRAANRSLLERTVLAREGFFVRSREYQNVLMSQFSKFLSQDKRETNRVLNCLFMKNIVYMTYFWTFDIGFLI